MDQLTDERTDRQSELYISFATKDIFIDNLAKYIPNLLIDRQELLPYFFIYPGSFILILSQLYDNKDTNIHMKSLVIKTVEQTNIGKYIMTVILIL